MEKKIEKTESPKAPDAGKTKSKRGSGITFKGAKTNAWLSVSRWSVVLAIGLLPLVFWPFATDVLGYGKQLTLVTFTGLALIGWLVQSLLSGELRLRKGLFGWVSLLFIVGVIASVALSSNPTLAFWGASPSAFSGINFLSLGLLSYVAFTVADKALFRRASVALFGSMTLMTIIGLASLFFFDFLSLFNLDASIFNTIGPTRAFSIAGGALMVMAIQALLDREQWLSHNKLLMPLAVAGLIVGLIAVIAINYQYTWLGIGIAGLLITVTSLAGRKVINPKLFILPFILVFVSIALFMQLFPLNFGLRTTPLEVTVNQEISFDLVKKSFENNDFIFGSGFGSYSDLYTQNRPASLNQSVVVGNQRFDFWGLRFTIGSSGLYTLLAEGGYLMTALLGLFILLTAATSFVRNKGISPFLVGLTVLTALFVVYPFNTAMLSLIFITGLLSALGSSGPRENEFRSLNLARSTGTYLQTSLVLTAVLLMVGFGMLFQWQRVLSNQVLAESIVGKSVTETITDLERAVTNSYGSDDEYLRALSQAYLLAANQESISVQDRATLVSTALQAAQAAVAYRPESVVNTIRLASVYEAIIGIVNDPRAAELANSTYESAIAMDPFNPSLSLAIGRAQFREANRLEAQLEVLRQSATQNREQIQQLDELYDGLIVSSESWFNKSLEQKIDYEPAHLLLAQLFDATGRRDEAIAKATDVVRINQGDAGNWFRLGLLYYQDQDFENAETALTQAIAISETYSNARYYLGLTLERLRKDDEAIAQFKRIQELNPQNAEVSQIISNLERGVDPLLNLSVPAPQDRIIPPVVTPNVNTVEATTAEESEALDPAPEEDLRPTETFEPDQDDTEE